MGSQAVYALAHCDFVNVLYGIQFFHRSFAFIIVGFIIYIWKKGIAKSISPQHNKALHLLLIIVLLQTTVGVFTILFMVPFSSFNTSIDRFFDAHVYCLLLIYI